MVSGRMTDTPPPGHPAELSALSLPDRYLRPGTLQLGAPPPLSVAEQIERLRAALTRRLGTIRWAHL